jgi:hypothetical protein
LVEESHRKKKWPTTVLSNIEVSGDLERITFNAWGEGRKGRQNWLPGQHGLPSSNFI